MQLTAYEISECDWSSDVCSFVFKQKTAYEISECDWSSRVLFRSDRKSTRLNSSHIQKSRMPSSARKKKNQKITRLKSSHIQKYRITSSARKNTKNTLKTKH